MAMAIVNQTSAENSWGATNAASVPMSSAPAALPTVPGTETAPDMPASTGRSVVIIRGDRPLQDPISVAQVSAAAAASAAANPAYQIEFGLSQLITTNRSGSPPFAITCTASRLDPRAAILP